MFPLAPPPGSATALLYSGKAHLKLRPKRLSTLWAEVMHNKQSRSFLCVRSHKLLIKCKKM